MPRNYKLLYSPPTYRVNYSTKENDWYKIKNI